MFLVFCVVFQLTGFIDPIAYFMIQGFSNDLDLGTSLLHTRWPGSKFCGSANCISNKPRQDLFYILLKYNFQLAYFKASNRWWSVILSTKYPWLNFQRRFADLKCLWLISTRSFSGEARKYDRSDDYISRTIPVFIIMLSHISVISIFNYKTISERLCFLLYFTHWSQTIRRLAYKYTCMIWKQYKYDSEGIYIWLLSSWFPEAFMVSFITTIRNHMHTQIMNEGVIFEDVTAPPPPPRLTRLKIHHTLLPVCCQCLERMIRVLRISVFLSLSFLGLHFLPWLPTQH